MRIFLILFSLIFLISCSDNIDKCSDPIKKIITLISEKPDDWTTKYEYSYLYKHLRLEHKSGLVVTRTYMRAFSFEKWNGAEDKGWKISSPEDIPLTETESDMITKAYEDWVNTNINKAKCKVSNMLGDVGVTSDEIKKYENKSRNDFD